MDSDRHREDMRTAQVVHREKMSEKRDAEQGLLLVYTGAGKGKSTAAFGLIARALGWGAKVGVVQFIKGKWITGERQFFGRFPEQLVWRTMGEGFTWDVQDLERDVAAARAALQAGADMMTSGQFDIVVLDEINIALRSNYLSPAEVLAPVQARAPHCSVVLTGRSAPQAIMDAADLVTEMTEIRHPFHAGLKAKRGIDF